MQDGRSATELHPPLYFAAGLDLTNELKSFLEVLAQVLAVVVGGGEALVAQAPAVGVVQGQVGGDIENVPHVEAQHPFEVLRVSFVAQEQEGQNGAQLGVLQVRREWGAQVIWAIRNIWPNQTACGQNTK